jgi:rhomboid protease GluP
VGGDVEWGPRAPEPVSPGRAGAPAPSPWDRFVRHYHDGPVTVSIVVCTVAVWLVHEALITWAGINTDLTLGDPGSAIHGQPWRLITPLVVHFGILHIGLNMFTLWMIGPPVEKVIGRPMYIASYFLSGAGGQVVSDLYYQWHPAHQNGQVVTVLSGGASGAIFGVVGLLIGNHVITAMAEKSGRRSVQQWRFTSSAAKSLAIQGTIWIILTSIAIPGIDNWAHLGGVAVGLVIGGVVAWSRTEPAAAHA